MLPQNYTTGSTCEGGGREFVSSRDDDLQPIQQSGVRSAFLYLYVYTVSHTPLSIATPCTAWHGSSIPGIVALKLRSLWIHLPGCSTASASWITGRLSGSCCYLFPLHQSRESLLLSIPAPSKSRSFSSIPGASELHVRKSGAGT